MSKPISWRCPDALKTELETIAIQKNISVSSVINIAVSEFVERKKILPMFAGCSTGILIPDCDMSDEFLKKYRNKTDDEIKIIRQQANQK